MSPRRADRSDANTGGSDVWLTPPEVLDPIRALYGGIGLDPCTELNNPTGARSFCTTLDNGLDAPWGYIAVDGVVFVNPPYSRIKQDWGPKILAEAVLGTRIITLLPSRTDRQWFRDLYRWCAGYPHCYLWPGRLRFLNGNGERQGQAPYPSVLFSFNCELPHYEGGLYI